MSNLKKYMAKKGKAAPEAEPAPEWQAVEAEGHEGSTTDDFQTADTEKDPIHDHKGHDSKKADSNLEKYQKMKKK